MKDKIREAIKFITSLRSLDTYIMLTPEQVRARNLKLNDITFMLDKGGKYEELCEMLVERYGYAYVHKLIDKTAEEVSQVREIMAKLRGEFFGYVPRTRNQKINDMLHVLLTPGVHPDPEELRQLLIELRDEEEEK